MSFRYRFALVLAGIVLLVSAGCSAGKTSHARTSAKPASQEDKKLISAALDANFEEMEAAIKSGADVNAFDDALGSPLSASATRGHLEAVRLLIEKGADVNVANKYGGTPLQDAVGSGKVDIVRLLLSKGADPNAAALIKVNGRETKVSALALAKGIGHGEIVNLLIQAGAKE
jgi:ankyrin repeat protein